MTPEEIITTLTKLATELANVYGVASMSLFGSAVSGDWTSASDVDIVVEFEGGATFDRLIALRDRLERALGVGVDLVARKGLRPRMLRIIDETAIRVA